MSIQSKPSWVPRCPNHGSPLEGCGFPLPQKGVGKCPISGCDFEFEATVDQEKTVLDKFGNMKKEVGWKIEGTGVKE